MISNAGSWERMMGFGTIDAHTMTALQHAGERTEVKFLFPSGDLHQKGELADFLKRRGIKVCFWDVHPGVNTEEEYKAGLKLIFEYKLGPWWEHGRKFVEQGACTQAEFDAAYRIFSQECQAARDQVRAR